MSNTLQSKICIKIISVINASEKIIQQNLFATDLYVYTEFVDKQFIYFLDKEDQYIIDHTQNQLKKIDLSKQILQLQQMKQMIGELSAKEKSIEQGRHIQIANSKPSVIQLNVEAQAINIEGLEKTVYHSFEIFQSKIQPVSIPLQPNEILSSLQTSITFAGKIQKSSMKLLDIKLLDNSCLYDNYLEWEISS